MSPPAAPIGRRHVAALALVVVLAVAAGIATANPSGSPDLSVTVQDTTVVAGEDTTLDLVIQNAGTIRRGGTSSQEERLTTARGVTVSLDAESAPVTVRTTERAVGNVPEGVTDPIPFEISVHDDATPGTYRVTARVAYEYTQEINTQGTGDPDHLEVPRVRYFTVELEVEEAARFRVESVEPRIRVGDSGTLAFTIRNVGTAAAYDSRVSIETGDPALTIGTETLAAGGFTGRWAPGETRRVEVQAGIADDAVVREYPVTARVTFEDANGLDRESEPLVTGFRPGERQSFSLRSVNTSAPIGGAGLVAVALVNEGPVTAHDATVTLVSSSPDVTFGGGTTEAESAVGTWEPGEAVTVESRLEVADTAVRRDYSLRAVVRYEDGAGRERDPRRVVVGVRPLPEQTFSVGTVESGLRVDASGTLTVSVTNTGSRPAREVAVSVRPSAANLTPRSGSVAVGDLSPGESARATFTVDVPASADPGPRQVAFAVEYRDALDERRVAAPVDARVPVGERRKPLVVEPVNATFAVDSVGTLTLRVTNNGAEPVRDVTAVLSVTDPPFESDDPAAFVPRLDPGESATVSFLLDVSNDAIPKTHPVSVDFTYEDVGGETRESGPAQVGVRVVERPGSGLPIVPAVVVIAALGIAGAWWYRRRE